MSRTQLFPAVEGKIAVEATGNCYYFYGKNTARVAVAREMLKIIYSMLTNNRPFVKA